MIRNLLSRNLNTIIRRSYSKYAGMTGGEIVYNKLKEKSVKNVWISTGGAIMPVVDAFYKGDINYFLSSLIA